MSDFAPILALLEKHRPPPKPKLPIAQEIRLAVIKPHLRINRRLPDFVVRAIYAEYQNQPNANQVAALLGLSRQAVTHLFRRRGLKTRRKLQPHIMHAGIAYAFDGERYYRQCKRGCQHIYLHKILWVERHGPIPVGYRVVFVDASKPTDFSDTNLRLLTEAQYRQHVIGSRWRKYRARVAA